MYSTKIVTSFLLHMDKFLILKRSQNVKSMKGLWAGISGIIEGNEEPLQRAKTEVFEEIGLTEDCLVLLKTAPQMQISSQYANHEWTVFSFLFSVKEPNIKLNWENSEYRWIYANEISKYQTVPSLDKVLASLL
ncbi:MAG: NUDIX domain-containing protein [Thaumarchaeota archaeon]|nr:NUDIX domain-containing protein [Nitrososphaerota archaeon]MBI3641027.1 NUDIX domain-containing protein [Nitrososphaerota archaeon]